jgi:hypothetical protein
MVVFVKFYVTLESTTRAHKFKVGESKFPFNIERAFYHPEPFSNVIGCFVEQRASMQAEPRR